MNIRILQLSIIGFISVSCLPAASSDKAAESITQESLLAPIEILSSDQFEGRAPATRGEDLTVDYIENYLSALGVEPGMADGSYTQNFPLLSQSVDRETAFMGIKNDGETAYELTYYDEFMAWPSNQEETVTVENADLIYVGYGIQAQEYEWDDYKGTDVSGKILIFKNSDPSYDQDLFEGETRLYYGRWDYKFEIAKEMGALGAIIIHTTPTAGYPWQVVANSWGRERFYLINEEDRGVSLPEINGWLAETASEQLFESAGLDLQEQLAAADDPDFHPVVLDATQMDIRMQASYNTDMGSRNVLGIIEGNDPDVSDEYLVYTAHYDHIGIADPAEGDSVNNGALDNASGVSALLNLASAYKIVEDDIRRSVLFLFAGAEEMGLLGSQYWAENPTVHPGKVTANINLDGMNVYGETRDLVLIGYGRNTVSDIIVQNAEASGRSVKPDLHPAQGYFYRSDHFSLAKAGIPAAYPDPGNEFIDKPGGYSTFIDSLQAANYHSVNDEINEYWDLSGMEQDTRLIFYSGLDILNADGLMEWREGDEFRETRLQMLEQAGP